MDWGATGTIIGTLAASIWFGFKSQSKKMESAHKDSASETIRALNKVSERLDMVEKKTDLAINDIQSIFNSLDVIKKQLSKNPEINKAILSLFKDLFKRVQVLEKSRESELVTLGEQSTLVRDKK